jgi:hypothetical protein
VGEYEKPTIVGELVGGLNPLTEGAAVTTDGLLVLGTTVGMDEVSSVGLKEGLPVGHSVGLPVGNSVGLLVGHKVGLPVGHKVGLPVGWSVSAFVTHKETNNSKNTTLNIEFQISCEVTGRCSTASSGL